MAQYSRLHKTYVMLAALALALMLAAACGEDGSVNLAGDTGGADVSFSDGLGGDCGDGICGEGENCSTCLADCGCEAGLTCTEGQCLASECKAGETKCEGQQVMACGADGQWIATAACPEDKVCYEASCCAPVCTDKECGADGCGGACGECAQELMCIDGACLECATTQDCGGALVCDDGACVMPGACGDGQCAGDETECSCANDCGVCGGCCDGDACQAGTSDDACGTGGEACEICADAQQCKDAQCQADPFCGDDECGDGEDCASCPDDCGECGDCGNGDCGDDENCGMCPADCGSCEGDCCVANGSPGCEDPEITLCACELDDYCCDVDWDGLCAGAAGTDCGADCKEGECGDDTCDANESCESCPEDCGECPECGDGVCDDGEDCDACPDDCPCAGDCCAASEAPGCDDAEISACVCEADSFCCEVKWDSLCVDIAGNDCGADCGGPGECGDGVCDDEEDCESCPEDCEECADCGDGECLDGENCWTCAEDCGDCEGDCCEANGTPGCEDVVVTDCVCSDDAFCCGSEWDAMCVGVASDLCEADCGPVCGDGECDAGELCGLCPEDCGACPPVCGDGDCNGDETKCSCAQDCGACGGCCTAGQACVSGGADDACGDGGQACAACTNGDICFDGACIVGTCQGKCGAPGAPGNSKGLGDCYCDELCKDLSDCCPDVCSECSQLTDCIAAPACGADWTLKEFNYGTLCYRAFNDALAWPDAEQYCKSVGGHLVSIHSKEENDFVLTVLDKGVFDDDDFWVGAHQQPLDSPPAQNWTWSDSTPQIYANWSNNEPNDNGGPGSENCISVYGDAVNLGGAEGTWNDAPCGDKFEYICKKPAQ